MCHPEGANSGIMTQGERKIANAYDTWSTRALSLQQDILDFTLYSWTMYPKIHCIPLYPLFILLQDSIFPGVNWGSTTVAPSAPGQRRPLEPCLDTAFNGLFHRGFPAKVEPIVESDPNEKEETPVIQWWMPMGCSRLIMVDRIWTFSDIFFVDWVVGDTVSTIRSYYIYIVESYHHILWNWCMNVKFQVFEDWGIKPLEEHESSTCCRTPCDA